MVKVLMTGSENVGEKQDLLRASEGDLATVDLIKEWLRHELMRGATPNTLQVYRRGMEIFQEWAEDQGGIDGTARDIMRFKQELKENYAPQTVNLRLSAVRSFYRFLMATDRVSYSPAETVRGVKRSKSTKHKRDATHKQ